MAVNRQIVLNRPGTEPFWLLVRILEDSHKNSNVNGTLATKSEISLNAFEINHIVFIEK
jgi:hypothetical protein